MKLTTLSSHYIVGEATLVQMPSIYLFRKI